MSGEVEGAVAIVLVAREEWMRVSWEGDAGANASVVVR
jgi:hypothetical protein